MRVVLHCAILFREFSWDRAVSALLPRGVNTMYAAFTPSIFLLLMLSGLPQCSARDAPDYARLRQAMVEDQIVARGVRDLEVIRAMKQVPRHLFVPPAGRPFAYGDHPLPIGEGQTISQPYVVAFMTEALGLRPGDKVLEIGTGSGYQAAVLAELKAEVYSVEIVEALGRRARQTLKSLGYENVHLRRADGYRGWPDQAPCDAVIVT